ncbi:MAG: sulfurtransferase complex subunit TusC [Gammaproteobacteria bacterium]|nr:sulfurtransferase complex subunit TusC [Gammaproteobacteria bacterium]MBA3731119.1 sulfurtransferase complex subunit TusC [Gammaproteobacteria bacterium]
MTNKVAPNSRIKKFMLVNRKPPHGSIYAQEALEIALIAGAFDQDVSLAFLDDGIYQLVAKQDTQWIGAKNFSKTFRALKDFGVSKLYVERESLQARGLDATDLLVEAAPVTAQALAELMAQQDVVLSF